MKGGSTVIAFAEDPTGYKFELIQRPGTQDPICQVMLRVTNLEKSIKYYTEALGMKLLRTKENPEYKYTLAFLGYGPEETHPVSACTLLLVLLPKLPQMRPSPSDTLGQPKPVCNAGRYLRNNGTSEALPLTLCNL